MVFDQEHETMIADVVVLATTFHSSQRRKGVNIPYSFHLFDVTKRLIDWGERDPITICASLLHDSVEDVLSRSAKHPLNELDRILRNRVRYFYHNNPDRAILVGYVSELTFWDNPKWNNQQKQAEKKKYLDGFKEASLSAFKVKLSDRICNVRDFYFQGEAKYAVKYYHKADVLWQTLLHRRADFPEGSMYRRILTDWTELKHLLGITV